VLDFGNNLRIATEFKPQGLSYGFAGNVIFGWAKAAHENDHVRPRERQRRRLNYVFPTIAHDGFEDHFHAKLVQLFGEIK
jgi:hypothetical protein